MRRATVSAECGALLACIVLVACSGRSARRGHPMDIAGAGASGESMEAAATAAGTNATDGTDGTEMPDAGTSAGGAAADVSPAGASGSDTAGSAAVSDGSGTELCQNDRDCHQPLLCTSLFNAKQQACMSSCSSTKPCDSWQDCVVAIDGHAVGCTPECEWPWDCSFGFDCIDHTGHQDYVCLPAQWSIFFGPESRPND
jgi:hypothetical protein